MGQGCLRGQAVDRAHSQLIIILLAGILAVLLFGREAILGSMEGVFWLGLVIGVPVLLIWGLVAFTRYLKDEVRDYREEVRRDRAKGRPWLYLFVLWPGLIANCLVFGVAAYRYFDGSCQYFKGDCIQTIPYWWLPITVFAVSFLFW